MLLTLSLTIDLVRTGFSQGVESRSDSYYDSDFRISLGRKKKSFAGREVRIVYKPKSVGDRAPGKSHFGGPKPANNIFIFPAVNCLHVSSFTNFAIGLTYVPFANQSKKI